MGVGETPMRMTEAEALLAGTAFDDDAIDAAAHAVHDAVEPMSDLHASADYRRHLARALTRRVLTTAWQRAGVAPS